MKEKISVIVPIYNVEDYLKCCVDSIIKQTYKDLEIILVNDGSTDSSLKICMKYAKKDKRVIVVDKVNGGLSDARNAGLEKATGKYVMFTDSDDFLTHDAVEKLYKAIKEHDVEFVTANFIFVNNDGTPWKKPMFSSRFNEGEISIEDYHQSFYLMNSGVWNKLFKKEFLDKNKLKFQVGLPAEDAIFTTLAFLKAKKSYYIKDIVYNYRQRDIKKGNLSISFNCSVDYFKGISKAYKMVYKNFLKYNEINFYRYYYAKSTSYILYKFIDSRLLTNKEKIRVLKEMKWFFDLKPEINAPVTSASTNMITDAIVSEEYDRVIDYATILAEAREYMSNEKRERMARPDYNKYKRGN